MIEQLREATRARHTELDHAVYPIIQSIQSPADYARVLRMFYGYFQPVYEKMEPLISSVILPDYRIRRKPVAILDDLAVIGEQVGTVIALCPDTPVITTTAEAFGALYVLEGSTMGGKIIAKKIKENTGLSDDHLSFFGAYRELNPAKWAIFIEALNHPHLQEESSSLIDTATDTFNQFKNWVVLQYPEKTHHKLPQQA